MLLRRKAQNNIFVPVLNVHHQTQRQFFSATEPVRRTLAWERRKTKGSLEATQRAPQ
jgi:hypothetical protein